MRAQSVCRQSGRGEARGAVTQAEYDSLGSTARVAIVWACRTARQMRKVRVRKQTPMRCERGKTKWSAECGSVCHKVQSTALPASLFWIITNNCISPQLLIHSGEPTARYQTDPVSVSLGDVWQPSGEADIFCKSW